MLTLQLTAEKTNNPLVTLQSKPTQLPSTTADLSNYIDKLFWFTEQLERKPIKE